jgi:hypothetical protein
MLAELTREEFDAWELSDRLDGTVSGIARLTWTVAEAAAVLSSQTPFGVEIEPWQFVPGAEPPDKPEADDDQILTDLDAGFHALAAASRVW